MKQGKRKHRFVPQELRHSEIHSSAYLFQIIQHLFRGLIIARAFQEYSSTGISLQGLNPRAVAAAIWTRQRLGEPDKQWLRDLKLTRLVANFSLVHATLDAPEKWGYVFDKLAAAASFTYQNTSVCFFGHTHIPLAFIRDSGVRACTYSKFKVEPGHKYFINVGSVGEPRDGSPLAAYVIHDVSESSIQLKRIPYDAELTDAKVRAAGLPDRPRPRKVDS